MELRCEGTNRSEVNEVEYLQEVGGIGIEIPGEKHLASVLWQEETFHFQEAHDKW